MPRPVSSSRNWRYRKSDLADRRSTTARVVALFVLIAVLVAIYIYVTWPKTRAVPYIGALFVPQYPAAQRQLPFLQNDLQALDRVFAGDEQAAEGERSRGRVVFDRQQLLSEVEVATRLRQQFAQARPKDTAILYVAAHGVAFDPTPYLLGGSSDLVTRQQLFPAETLLKAVSGLAVKTKLVLLDAGSIDADLRAGMPVNQFPFRLHEQVKRIADPNLWVICSHAMAQRSHASLQRRRTLFSWAVTDALEQLGRDRGREAICVDEFYSYLVEHLAATSRVEAGSAQQPLLMRGGQGWIREEDRAALAAAFRDSVVFHRDQIVPPTAPAADGQDAAAPPATGAADLPPINAAASLLGLATSRPGPTAPWPRSAAANPLDGWQEPQPAAPETTATAPSAAPQEPAATPPATPAPPPDTLQSRCQALAVDVASVEEAIRQLWAAVELLQSRQFCEWSPVDFAPHLWRRLLEELLAHGREVQVGSLRESPEQTVADAMRLKRRLLELAQAIDALRPAATPAAAGTDRVEEHLVAAWAAALPKVQSHQEQFKALKPELQQGAAAIRAANRTFHDAAFRAVDYIRWFEGNSPLQPAAGLAEIQDFLDQLQALSRGSRIDQPRYELTAAAQRDAEDAAASIRQAEEQVHAALLGQLDIALQGRTLPLEKQVRLTRLVELPMLLGDRSLAPALDRDGRFSRERLTAALADWSEQSSEAAPASTPWPSQLLCPLGSAAAGDRMLLAGRWIDSVAQSLRVETESPSPPARRESEGYSLSTSAARRVSEGYSPSPSPARRVSEGYSPSPSPARRVSEGYSLSPSAARPVSEGYSPSPSPPRRVSEGNPPFPQQDPGEPLPSFAGPSAAAGRFDEPALAALCATWQEQGDWFRQQLDALASASPPTAANASGVGWLRAAVLPARDLRGIASDDRSFAAVLPQWVAPPVRKRIAFRDSNPREIVLDQTRVARFIIDVAGDDRAALPVRIDVPETHRDRIVCQIPGGNSVPIVDGQAAFDLSIDAPPLGEADDQAPVALTLSVEGESARQLIDVVLPRPDSILLAARQSHWRQTPDGYQLADHSQRAMVLRPLTFVDSTVTFSLENHAGRAKSIVAEFYALPDPGGRPHAAGRISAEGVVSPALRQAVQSAIDAGTLQPFFTSDPLELAPFQQAGSSQKILFANKPLADPAAAPPPGPIARAVDHGMLCRLRESPDGAGGRDRWYWIEFRRVTSDLLCRVPTGLYDRNERLFRVPLEANTDLFDFSGKLEAVCQAAPYDSGSPRLVLNAERLRGEIVVAIPEVLEFEEVARDDFRNQLAIDVNGEPRAFIFQINPRDTWPERKSVRHDISQMRVTRVRTPSADNAEVAVSRDAEAAAYVFQNPRRVLAALEVDWPYSANSELHVKILPPKATEAARSLDAVSDRRESVTLRIEGGQLFVRADAVDHELDLNSDGWEGVARIEGLMQVDGQTPSSPRASVGEQFIFDRTPPTPRASLTFADASQRATTQVGKPVTFEVRADDDLTPIRQVELFHDAEPLGHDESSKHDEDKVEPKRFLLQGGVWRLDLEFKEPGPRNFLARVTDAAGNARWIGSAELSVEPAAEGEENAAPRAKKYRVVVRVKFGSNPLGDAAQLTTMDLSGAPQAGRREGSEVIFDSVPAGKHKLVLKGKSARDRAIGADLELEITDAGRKTFDVVLTEQ